MRFISSNDGGQTFQVTNAQCKFEQDEDNTFGRLYDGTAVAIRRGGVFDLLPEAFVAFWDVAARGMKIWRSRDVRHITMYEFEQVECLDADCMPAIDSHPRLRVDEFDSLWMMAIRTPSGGTPAIVANRYGEGSPWVSLPVHPLFTRVGGAALNPNLTLRMLTPFSFDVGRNEDGDFEMRYAYAYRNEDGRPQIQAGYCNGSFECHLSSLWNTEIAYPGHSHMFPSLRYANVGGTHVWKLSWISTAEGDDGHVAVWATDLVRAGNATQSLIHAARRVTPLQEPCPDARGYWGDYDDMGYNAATQSFVRPFTDSSRGCTRMEWNSLHHDVAAVSIPAIW